MKQSDLVVVAPIQPTINSAPDVDSATTTSTDKPFAPVPGPTNAAALSGAVWKPTFKEFLYAHRLASKVTRQS